MFERTLRQTTLQMCRNTVAVSMAAVLQYLLITLKGVALEKVSLIDTQISKAVF